MTTDTPVISLKRDGERTVMAIERMGLCLVGTVLFLKDDPTRAVLLSNHESRIVWGVMIRTVGELALYELVELLWDNPDVEPDYAYQAVRTLKSRVNDKLVDLGFAIVARWGWGY